MTPNELTLFDRIIIWLKNNPVIAGIIICWLVLSSFVFTLEKVVMIYSTLKKQPNGLELAQDLSKGQFSRDLTELAWRRLFCARLFINRIVRNAPPEQRDEAWNRYVNATEEWNAMLMVNLQLLSKFYPHSNKRLTLEGPIQKKWQDVDKNLADLRYLPAATSADNRSSMSNGVNEVVDDLNNALYSFVTGLDSPVQRSP